MSTYNGRYLGMHVAAAAAMIAVAEAEVSRDTQESIRKEEPRLSEMEQDREAERARRADMGSSPAATPVRIPHQGKRERERRLRQLKGMTP